MSPRTAPTRSGLAPLPPGNSSRGKFLTTGLVLLAVLGLFVVFRSGQRSDRGGVITGSRAAFQVGQPGAGQPAPAFSLAASTGKSVSLSDYRGKTVLVFFQEGIGCQPCWDQIRDLEKDKAALSQAGIDDVVSITTSPTDLVAQKTRDDHLQTPVLSDPDLAVSRAYHANSYGMMGDSRDGHSFLLIGPTGQVTWRADYGGSPNYTMYLPVATILRDLRNATSAGAPPASSDPHAR
jgi:peroxiredoxin